MQAKVLSKLSGARRHVAFSRGRRYGPAQPASPAATAGGEPAAQDSPDRPAAHAAAHELRSRGMLPPCDAAPAQRQFRLERSAEGRLATLAPIGELDGASAIDFEEALAGAVAARKSILVDLSRLTFIDSSGLWALTVAYKTCRRRGLGLCLVPGPEHVQKVFEVTGLYDLLPFISPEPADLL